MSMYIYIYIYIGHLGKKIKDTWRQLNHPILFTPCNPWSSWLQPSLPGSGISLSTSWSRQDITVKHVTSFSGNIWKQSRWTLTTYNSLDLFLWGGLSYSTCFFLKCSGNKKLLYLQNRNFLQASQHLIFLHPHITVATPLPRTGSYLL